MANHKSAIKRIRQTEKRNTINRHNRSTLRTQVKKLIKAIEAGESTEAQTLFSPTVSLIDKTVRKGGLNKGTADRMKSRLSARVKSVKAAA
ncbi:MAG: 30S ribosomal protein S20 [Acidobacteria bacterium]|nr:30S ribosomal protein S20 [Acidobacteriota bacterium]